MVFLLLSTVYHEVVPGFSFLVISFDISGSWLSRDTVMIVIIVTLLDV